MNKLVKRLLTGTLAFATILTALPVTAVHASGNQYWTESAERVGYIEHVMNDGSIKSTFNEGHMKVEGETAYCVARDARVVHVGEPTPVLRMDIKHVLTQAPV